MYKSSKLENKYTFIFNASVWVSVRKLFLNHQSDRFYFIIETYRIKCSKDSLSNKVNNIVVIEFEKS